MSHPASGPVCRDQWSEEETDEEEEEEQVSAESGPREDQGQRPGDLAQGPMRVRVSEAKIQAVVR